MTSADTELWTEETVDGRVFRCLMRFAPGGVEVVITEGTTVVARELFSGGTDAYAWAEDARAQVR